MDKRLISLAPLLLLSFMASAARGDPNTGLVAHWQFEGSFNDAVGTNHATPRGDARIVADPERGQVVEFDGTGDYLEIGNSPGLNITGDKLTLAGWVWHDDVRGNPEIIIAKVFNETAHKSPYFSYGLHILANGQPRVWISRTGGASNTPGSTYLESAKWYHLAGVYDGARLRLYLDGVLVGDSNVTGAIVGYDTVLRLGINGGLTEPMDGKLDEVRIYDRALTDREIASLATGQSVNAAWNPNPPDGATRVSLPLLEWDAGDNAVFHDVYLGTSLDLSPANVVAWRIPQTVHALADGIEPGVTYYWRVDEVEADLNTIHTGQVWSFTAASAQGPGDIAWVHKGSTTGDLPTPNAGSQQTCCVVFDIDNDGVDDFAVGERTKTPSVVWYKYNGAGWNKYVVDDTPLKPEAGGDAYDIDGDGDMDLVLGQDASGNVVWWWENPCPDFGQPWTRRIIKNSGGNKHHDQSFGDYDGDGKVEFVTWNQEDKKLLFCEIPDEPKTAGPWSPAPIYQWSSGREREGFPSIPVDIDLDGKLDIVGGGRWFKHRKGTEFQEHPIDEEMTFTQCAAGQLVNGGRPEVVFSPGDMDGDAKWYEWDGENWMVHALRRVLHGHTCEIRDVDQDGNLDIMIGEMGDPGAGDEANIYLWYGDGMGGFEETVAWHGQGIHEGKFGDFDGDGDLDILLKPYHHNAPRLDILLNAGTRRVSLDRWQRYHIANLPRRAMFVQAGDINDDGHVDLVAGGWWWESPGTLDGLWKQHTVGAPLQNMAMVYDFDGDGDLDILGTQGVGSDSNHSFVWARNDGAGNFEIVANVDYSGGGDFLQGCALGELGQGLQVVLSWHRDGGGIYALSVPNDPAGALWTTMLLSTTVSTPPQGEDLDLGDIDRDGDLDILLGEKWLRNDGDRWLTLELGQVTQGEPDRCDLADVNGDGRLDAVVSLENGTDVLWYEAPADPAQPWARNRIGVAAGQGFSMDTADFDRDGDPDVVIGEHRGSEVNRVVLFENANRGALWSMHVIDSGPKDQIDHHDGVQAVDLDRDGDLDLISIGWYNPKLWVFENLP